MPSADGGILPAPIVANDNSTVANQVSIVANGNSTGANGHSMVANDPSTGAKST